MCDEGCKERKVLEVGPNGQILALRKGVAHVYLFAKNGYADCVTMRVGR